MNDMHCSSKIQTFLCSLYHYHQRNSPGSVTKMSITQRSVEKKKKYPTTEVAKYDIIVTKPDDVWTVISANERN